MSAIAISSGPRRCVIWRSRPGFFHNGAFVTLEDAIRFHLNVVDGAESYDPNEAGVPADLAQVGPVIDESAGRSRAQEAASG